MKIIFDLRNVGLGNNGGSSTLVKSANALIELHHDVIFIDSMKNQHTWTPLKAQHIIPKADSDVESADFIIATGYKSAAPTMASPERFGRKFHWIRGWETWQMPEKEIVERILKIDTGKLVNSICLQRKLKNYRVDSKIIRPGYDLNEITPNSNLKSNNDKIVLGGLNTKGKHFKIKRTNWIFDTYHKLKQKYKNLELWMFGNSHISTNIIDKYYHRPSMEQKNYFYNNVDIWLSPAMQEGLHMPPAEAMMAGSPVVGTDADMSGTEDYLKHNYNGLISNNNIQSFTENVEKLIINEKLRKQFGKNARKTIENIGDRHDNMQLLIEYFMEII
jgi:glycosyltransferase involved in cell wall biosynthesis